MAFQRRWLLRLVANLPLICYAPAVAQTSALNQFDAELASAQQDPDALADAHEFREYDFRERGPSDEELRAQPHLGKVYKSDLKISDRARDLLISFEVSNRAVYEKNYAHPIWPKGQSGVTIGIGYDLGYCTQEEFSSDWRDFLLPDAMKNLTSVCGQKGSYAGLLASFVADQLVPWNKAEGQFLSFLPAVAGQVAHTFPNCAKLSSHSFGALVSLVYNRGNSLRKTRNDPIDRRREMRVIRDLMSEQNFQQVPAQIRAMKRIWANDHAARGLIGRRELEAKLFEIGLG